MIDHGGGETGEVLRSTWCSRREQVGALAKSCAGSKGRRPRPSVHSGHAETVRVLPVRIARGDLRDTLG